MNGLRPSPWALAFAALTTLGLSTRTAEAGGGTYDPASRSFSLNYIFLDLPSGQLDQGQVNLSIRRTAPTAAQTQTVERFLELVSKKVFDLTSGRAKIGKLTEVQDVKKADVVISLTGSVKPTAGGAWASLHGFQQGGTLNLYYADLLNDPSDDVANTVVHELFHYVFGLPDEYPRGSARQRLCPLNAPGVERCLMDNYHLGFLGRLCRKGEHNPSAPGANGFPPVEPRDESCEEIIGAFFDKLGVKPDPGASFASTATSTKTDLKLTPAQTEAVLKPARDEMNKLKAGRTGGRLDANDRRALRDRVIRGLFDTLKGQLKGVNVSKVAVDLVGTLVLTPLGVPPGLQTIEKALLNKAFDLARTALNRDRKPGDIEKQLLDFAASEIKKNPSPAGAPIGEDELNYIHDLAQRAAAGQLPDQPETIEQLRDELLIEMYRTINQIANHINLPGAGDRGEDENRIAPRIQQLSKIPNRALGSRFGRRRTVLIEPPVLTSSDLSFNFDLAPTQGDPAANYNDIREENAERFARLIDRNRISAYSAASAPSEESSVGSIRVGIADLNSPDVHNVFRIDKKDGLTPPGKVNPGLAEEVFQRRRSRIFDLLATVEEIQIERDQIENIVVLVPPGGIPDEFADSISSLGEQFAGKADLRIDIALVGSAMIPAELRDLVVRSKGSILTVTDIDEVGAVAQRLAGEQTQGTWIIIPQQDMLVLKPNPNLSTSGRFLFERLRGIRLPHPVKTGLNDTNQVVLRPFYLDNSNDYELIVGLSQPLTIAGLTNIAGKDAETDKPTRSIVPPSEANRAIFPDPELRLMPLKIEEFADIRDFEEGRKLPIFAQTREIRLDRTKSNDRTLVFRLPASKVGVSGGWYTPVLTIRGSSFYDAKFKDDLRKNGLEIPPKLHGYTEDVIHFTFSVGTPTSKAQLSANLIQEGPNGAPVLQQGTIASDKSEAIITAVLSAGAAVLDAEVVGYVQQIGEGVDAIPTGKITFKDDGVAPDKTPADGIYTAAVPLEPRRAKSSEYRVFIDGHSVEGKTKFVPAGESIPKAGEEEKPAGAAEADLLNRKAPVFQRATSIHFSVPGNTGR